MKEPGDYTPINIALLGSTGSIGRQTLEVVRQLGDRFRVVALAAGRDREALLSQAASLPEPPLLLALADPGIGDRGYPLAGVGIGSAGGPIPDPRSPIPDPRDRPRQRRWRCPRPIRCIPAPRAPQERATGGP